MVKMAKTFDAKAQMRKEKNLCVLCFFEALRLKDGKEW
jgi:hypothetical protein